MSKFCHIFSLINYREKLGRGYYYKGNNQGWGVSLTGIDFSRVPFFAFSKFGKKKKNKNEDRDWTGKVLMTDGRKITGLITKK